MSSAKTPAGGQSSTLLPGPVTLPAPEQTKGEGMDGTTLFIILFIVFVLPLMLRNNR